MNSAVVLVVEDEFLLRMDMEQSLEDAGFIVVSAADADEAIEVLTTRADVVLVVTDVNMPGTMDGIALARFIINRWPPIKLIVASAHAREGLEGMPEGVPVFGKPYAHRAIHAKIKELLA